MLIEQRRKYAIKKDITFSYTASYPVLLALNYRTAQIFWIHSTLITVVDALVIYLNFYPCCIQR